MADIIETLIIEIAGDTSKFEKALKDTRAATKAATDDLESRMKTYQQATDSLSRSIGNLASMFSRLVSAISALQLAKMVNDVAQANETLGASAKILGTTTPELSKFENAMYEMGDTSGETNKSLHMLQATLQDWRVNGRSGPLQWLFNSISEGGLGLQAGETNMVKLQLEAFDSIHKLWATGVKDNQERAKKALLDLHITDDRVREAILKGGGRGVFDLMRRVPFVDDHDVAVAERLAKVIRQLGNELWKLKTAFLTTFGPDLKEMLTSIGEFLKSSQLYAFIHELQKSPEEVLKDYLDKMPPTIRDLLTYENPEELIAKHPILGRAIYPWGARRGAGEHGYLAKPPGSTGDKAPPATSSPAAPGAPAVPSSSSPPATSAPPGIFNDRFIGTPTPPNSTPPSTGGYSGVLNVPYPNMGMGNPIDLNQYDPGLGPQSALGTSNYALNSSNWAVQPLYNKKITNEVGNVGIHLSTNMDTQIDPNINQAPGDSSEALLGAVFASYSNTTRE